MDQPRAVGAAARRRRDQRGALRALPRLRARARRQPPALPARPADPRAGLPDLVPPLAHRARARPRQGRPDRRLEPPQLPRPLRDRRARCPGAGRSSSSPRSSCSRSAGRAGSCPGSAPSRSAAASPTRPRWRPPASRSSAAARSSSSPRARGSGRARWRTPEARRRPPGARDRRRRPAGRRPRHRARPPRLAHPPPQGEAPGRARR